MAGLCEGGNEPPGSLKASENEDGNGENEIRDFPDMEVKRDLEANFTMLKGFTGLCGQFAEPRSFTVRLDLWCLGTLAPGMRAAPFSRPELLSLRKALQFQAGAERSRSGGLALQLPSLR
ncbi:hypothetical protein ANN_20594 [Periplaneta americana]|uniref:Uncharacterized protein n=1 Tax=Periplaneta americana TaxID=6978 RepID=A0ABQ8SE70_PERAM|nr:hypothetical protein ANN_20594 [Periplaneta americana]